MIERVPLYFACAWCVGPLVSSGATTAGAFRHPLHKEQKPGEWGGCAPPFGLAVQADGSLPVGDEQNGVIYRG